MTFRLFCHYSEQFRVSQAEQFSDGLSGQKHNESECFEITCFDQCRHLSNAALVCPPKLFRRGLKAGDGSIQRSHGIRTFVGQILGCIDHCALTGGVDHAEHGNGLILHPIRIPTKGQEPAADGKVFILAIGDQIVTVDFFHMQRILFFQVFVVFYDQVVALIHHDIRDFFFQGVEEPEKAVALITQLIKERLPRFLRCPPAGNPATHAYAARNGGRSQPKSGATGGS